VNLAVSEPSRKLSGDKPQVLKGLYLFAGEPRRSSIEAAMAELAFGSNVTVEIVEIDITRDPLQHDLTNPELRQSYLEDIAKGVYDFVIVSPPCNTWSRACWANSMGPKPLRSRAHPFGFPWLEGDKKMKAEIGTLLAFFALAAMRAVSCARLAGHKVVGLLEHPKTLALPPKERRQVFGNLQKQRSC
jgi:hypothetical protein